MGRAFETGYRVGGGLFQFYSTAKTNCKNREATQFGKKRAQTSKWKFEKARHYYFVPVFDAMRGAMPSAIKAT